MAASDPNKLISKADKLTRLSLTRWNADWKSATVLYEQAANGFRLAKDYEKAKLAFEKASKGQEMLSSPWDAAKHMESAAALAKDLSNWKEVADFYRKAAELYMECGRPQPASDALAKGARALEDTVPEEAIQLYTDACTTLEEDEREQMAFDLYRAVTSVYIKVEKYEDAASCLLRLGLAADKCNATNSQCKAYLSAIIVYLYAHDFKQAEKCYNDCSQIDAFVKSDQNPCASKFLAAFTDGNVEEIKKIAQSSTVSHLDHVIIKIARKLPTGDVSALKAATVEDEEEPLDWTQMIDAFVKSDQNPCSSKFLAAYTDGNVENIKKIAQSSTVSHLDHAIIKIARKLPTGDVSALKAATVEDEEEPLNWTQMIDAFVKSDQNPCSSKFLAAYTDGNVEETKKIAQSSTVSHLDHVNIKIARKLPTGDVSALKAATVEDGEEPLNRTQMFEDEEEPLNWPLNWWTLNWT